MLTRLTNTTPIWWLLLAYAAFGLGFAFVNAPVTNTAVSGMPRAQAGVAAAIASTSRQVGQTLGVAIIGSAVVSGIVGEFATSFARASHLGWWIIVGCGLVVLVLGSRLVRAARPDQRSGGPGATGRAQPTEPEQASVAR